MNSKTIKELEEYALGKGATTAKVISTENVFVDAWVRQKCQYGCGGYGRYFTCPPYSPTPDETQKVLQGYEYAMLIEFSGLKTGVGNPDIHEIMFDLERLAFLNGLYKAFAYAGGPCRFCQSCPASEIENPNKFSRRLCKNPSKVRPAMEACGIDVFKTARMADIEIGVVQNTGDCFKRFGLLLLD
jgi:predicted metal-binding protein